MQAHVVSYATSTIEDSTMFWLHGWIWTNLNWAILPCKLQNSTRNQNKQLICKVSQKNLSTVLFQWNNLNCYIPTLGQRWKKIVKGKNASNNNNIFCTEKSEFVPKVFVQPTSSHNLLNLLLKGLINYYTRLTS